MSSPVIAALGVGAVAGLGVAMPIGPVGVLLLREGVERGFRVALGAALGVATVDAVYATVAVLAGSSVAQAVDDHRAVVRIVATAVLVVIACWGLVGVRRQWRALGAAVSDGSVSDDAAEVPLAATPVGAWLRFVAMTAVNPMTLLTFATVAVSLVGRLGNDAARPAFVVGVAVASAAWQTVIAGSGAALGHRLSPRARLRLSAVGHGVVLVLAGIVLVG